MREARRRQWQAPLASLATKQTAGKAPSLRVAAKCGACFVALLGVVVQATTFVARLAFIRILPATQSAWDLFRGSLTRSRPNMPVLGHSRPKPTSPSADPCLLLVRIGILNAL